MAHEEHEAQYGSKESADIREELVDFIEGTSIDNLLAGFPEVEGRVEASEVVGDDLEQIRHNESLVLAEGLKRQQALVRLNLIILQISDGDGSLSLGKGDQIPVLNKVIQIVGIAGVD